MLPMAFVLLQFIVSAKAGLVNFIDGQANVRLHQQVPAGKVIETAPRSHAEILLNPGSFLRMDESSQVVLESVDLADIHVRVISGSALLEAADVDKQTPIRVTTGALTVAIVSSGMYRFGGDTAVVLDGKLRTADSLLTLKKGQQITSVAGQYQKSAIPLNAGVDGLATWSRQRAGDLAKANAMAYKGRSSSLYYPGSFMNGSAWLYSPFLGGFTFMPRSTYRSYFGYNFVPIFVFAPTSFSGGGSSNGNVRLPASQNPPPTPSGNLGGRPPVSSNMGTPSQTPTFGGFGGGGGSAAPGGGGGGAPISHPSGGRGGVPNQR